MAPKIPKMTIKRRFTLLLSGDDSAADALQESPTRGLPHERFLLGAGTPVAPFLLLGLQGAQSGFDQNTPLACIQPVHLHATRDHLVLMHPDQIPLSDAESSALLEEAKPLLAELLGTELIHADANHWFVSAGTLASLATHTVDQAHGRNIDWWLPRDTHEPGIARAWRKLQNEIQMLWHISPSNAARQAQGLPAINSIWISGIGSIGDLQAPSDLIASQCIITDHPLLRGIAAHLNKPCVDQPNPENGVGGFAWLKNPESIWPFIQSALQDETLDELLLIDFPDGRERKRIIGVADIKKTSWAFWRKPMLLTFDELTGTASA